jgi:hypothetical protein
MVPPGVDQVLEALELSKLVTECIAGRVSASDAPSRTKQVAYTRMIANAESERAAFGTIMPLAAAGFLPHASLSSTRRDLQAVLRASGVEYRAGVLAASEAGSGASNLSSQSSSSPSGVDVNLPASVSSSSSSSSSSASDGAAALLSLGRPCDNVRPVDGGVPYVVCTDPVKLASVLITHLMELKHVRPNKRHPIRLKVGIDGGGGVVKAAIACVDATDANSAHRHVLLGAYVGSESLDLIKTLFGEALRLLGDLEALSLRVEGCAVEVNVNAYFIGDMKILSILTGFGPNIASRSFPCMTCDTSLDHVKNANLLSSAYQPRAAGASFHRVEKARKTVADVFEPLIKTDRIAVSILHIIIGVGTALVNIISTRAELLYTTALREAGVPPHSDWLPAAREHRAAIERKITSDQRLKKLQPSSLAVRTLIEQRDELDKWLSLATPALNSAIDTALYHAIGGEVKEYHNGTLIGNQVRALIKDESFAEVIKFFRGVTVEVPRQAPKFEGDVVTNFKTENAGRLRDCVKLTLVDTAFHDCMTRMFRAFAGSVAVLRKPGHISEDDVKSLEGHVDALRRGFSELRHPLTPKMHILIHHVVDFARREEALSDFSEEGLESLHHTCNGILRNVLNKPLEGRLLYLAHKLLAHFLLS